VFRRVYAQEAHLRTAQLERVAVDHAGRLCQRGGRSIEQKEGGRERITLAFPGAQKAPRFSVPSLRTCDKPARCQPGTRRTPALEQMRWLHLTARATPQGPHGRDDLTYGGRLSARA
jgi:hypothetical protein